jgi:hypothetical protein
VGWAAPPAQRRPGSRRKWRIGCGLLLLVLVIGVGACTVLLARSFGAAAAVMSASGGRIDGFNASTFNGRTTITFQAAKGVEPSEGPTLACDVVRPALATTELSGADWVTVDRAGDVIASKATPCP